MVKLRSPHRQPTHPGTILREDILPALNMTQAGLARCLKISRHVIFQIVHERRSMNADFAIRLARFLGTTPESWLGMQREFDLWRLIKKHAKTYQKIKQI